MRIFGDIDFLKLKSHFKMPLQSNKLIYSIMILENYKRNVVKQAVLLFRVYLFSKIKKSCIAIYNKKSGE